MFSKNSKQKPDSLYLKFVETYSFFIPESHSNFYSSEDLDLFLQARYQFASTRREYIQIHVYNPGEEYFWLINSSIIEIIQPDSLFIVDTLLDYCTAKKLRINQLIHPVIRIDRSKNGVMEHVDFVKENNEKNESVIYLEIARKDEEELNKIKKELETMFKELKQTVVDFQDMLQVLDDNNFSSTLYADECSWLKKNFIMHGMSFIKNANLISPYYGILKKPTNRKTISFELQNFAEKFSKEEIKYIESSFLFNISKENPLIYVFLHSENKTIFIVGHFSSRSESMIRNDIPSIKEKLNMMGESMRVTPNSFTRKNLLKAAQLIPLEVWLTRSFSFLHKLLNKIISNIYINEAEVELFMDPDFSMVWILRIIPDKDADQINGKNFSQFKEKFKIQNHYNIRRKLKNNVIVLMSCKSTEFPLKKLQEELQKNSNIIFSSWATEFRKMVSNRYVGEKEINDKIQQYLTGISSDFEHTLSPEDALNDLDILENLRETNNFRVRFTHSKNVDTIKVYSLVSSSLSYFVPILSAFRFLILAEHTLIYKGKNESEKYIYIFRVECLPSLNDEDRKRIAKCIAAVLNRNTTSESTNALAVLSRLNIHELNLIKTIAGYYYQIDKSYSRFSVRDTLTKYSSFTRALVDYFHSRHNLQGNNNEEAKSEKQIEESLISVESALDETICRALISVVKSIVRTNYYQDKSEIAIKIKSSVIDHMPRPVPLFEIYVYAYDMEGVHLRGGRVARGGIRWSDRTDDFRTEILGLMKAQMIKNTVIVPTGSKGGFIIKNRSFTDFEDKLKTGVEIYKRYITNLLELTDNISERGEIVRPKNIRTLDEDDPYLVVAADKGTASFSDIANEISMNQNYWLMDAFASGGQNGYDHKKQGITAKGAWESVRRHFHEMGLDPNKDSCTVVGIGDMGGDVFGNGMLLSDTIKLIAAFNHLYIFVDPEPEPKTSFKERKRLFEKTGNWNDYNEKLISRGGGIFKRNSRKINVTPQMKQSLGITKSTLSGEEFIQEILKSPSDLLWNGGIGTYVKSENETHFHARDPVNDRVRINASELRVKVVGEGGNLGFTQAARNEAALKGIRLNTDSIDNSGGVNMSDHEVNLKILLNTLLHKKLIKSIEERNKLIRKYETEEITRVLKHNYLNNLSLSVDSLRVQEQFLYFRTLIKLLSSKGVLNREQDSIPFEADLDKMEQGSKTLLRPILCSLMGFTKLELSKELTDAAIFDDDWYYRFASEYFPDELEQNYPSYIKSHPLKKEIIVTECINNIVNNAGISFFQRMSMQTGREISQIADTYIRLTEFIGADSLRNIFQNRWLQSELHYDYILLLEEKIFSMAKKFLINNISIKLLDEKNASDYYNILNKYSETTSFRIKRTLRGIMRKIDAGESSEIMKAYRKVSVLDDAFLIYLNNSESKIKWKEKEYAHIYEKFRIQDMKKIILSFNPKSTWEILFLSKLDSAVEIFFTKLLNHYHGKKLKRETEILVIVEDIIQQNRGGMLSTAACYEMLEYAGHLLD